MYTVSLLIKGTNFLLRRSTFKVGKRKQDRGILNVGKRDQEGGNTRHVSIKKLKRTCKENEEINNEVRDNIDELSIEGDAINIEKASHEFSGILVVPSNLCENPGVIFVFEKASLVPALVGKALLEVTDSNLYREGRVQAIYVKADQGVLIKIEPNTRLPRTFGSFCSMMLMLLQKFSTNAKGKLERSCV